MPLKTRKVHQKKLTADLLFQQVVEVLDDEQREQFWNKVLMDDRSIIRQIVIRLLDFQFQKTKPIPQSKGDGTLYLQHVPGLTVNGEPAAGISADTPEELRQLRALIEGGRQMGIRHMTPKERKKPLYEFVHQHVTSGEDDFNKIHKLVRQHNVEWLKINKGARDERLTSPASLKKEYFRRYPKTSS